MDNPEFKSSNERLPSATVSVNKDVHPELKSNGASHNNGIQARDDAHLEDAEGDNGTVTYKNGNISGVVVEIGGHPKSAASGRSTGTPHGGHEEHGEPMRFTCWVVELPKTVFFVTLGLHGAMLLTLVILLMSGYPVLPIVFDSLPLELRDHHMFLKGVAWTERNEHKDIIERAFTPDIQDPRTVFKEKIDMFFEEKNDKNVLTQKNLQDMKKTEDDLFYQNEFQDDFCMMRGGTCILPTSVLRFFDGTFSSVDSAFDDPDLEDIVNVLYLAEYYNETKGTLDFVLAEDAQISQTKAKSRIVRGYLSVGYPLDGYDDADSKTEKQDEELVKFYDKTFSKKFEKYYEKGVGKMNFYYNSGEMINTFILNSVFRDIVLFAGSFTFIFLFMWAQTQSLFITTFGLISVVNGFIITDILYICVFRYEYLGIFHVLSLFIILGIGADDIFVFLDTWKESGHKHWPSLAHRMDHTYKHAGMAMLYTSLTTACAFFVSAGSPFLAINSFGIFSGTLIIVNYFSVVLHFPAIVSMYHIYFEKYKCCCCCVKSDVTSAGKTKTVKKNAIVRFLAGPYWRVVTNRIGKWVILGLFACILAVFIYFASTLEINEEQTQFLPESTNFGAVATIGSEDFGTGENPQRVFIVWGLKEQDLSSCGFSEHDCYGKTRFNNKFNMNSDDAQNDMMDFCNRLKSLSSSKIKDLKIKENLITGEPEVNCFVEEIQDFLNEDESRDAYDPDTGSTSARFPAGTDLVYPVNEVNVSAIMSAVDYIYDESLLTADYSRWFEIANSYWLYDGFQLDTGLGPQFPYYDPLIGESKEDYTVTFDNTSVLPYVYKYATRLRYAAITVNLTINPLTQGFVEGIPIMDDWMDLVDKELKDMSSELKDGFVCTPLDYYGFDLWHWLLVQENLVRSAVQGILIGLAVALPILIVATRNWILGLLATLNIALITLCVVGFIPMMGWKLGVLESLNLVLVVGLAVDYCVHLTEGYSRCPLPDRRSRVQSTLEEVGISVLSGAITTLGSSFFLMFAIIIFFFQFGIFMFATIGFSVSFSIIFFMSLLATIGPQGETGSIMPFVNWVKNKCCRCCGDKNGYDM